MRDECLWMNVIHELQTMWYISYPMDYPMTIIIIYNASWIVKWTMMMMIDLSMKLEGCDHALLHKAHPAQQKETPQMSIFLFLFSNDFGSLNIGDPAKRSSLILYFPLLEQKRDEGPKTYHQGKYDNMQENKTWLWEAMMTSYREGGE